MFSNPDESLGVENAYICKHIHNMDPYWFNTVAGPRSPGVPVASYTDMQTQTGLSLPAGSDLGPYQQPALRPHCLSSSWAVTRGATPVSGTWSSVHTHAHRAEETS